MKAIYWSSTTILVLFLLWSSYTYFFQKTVIDGLRELGFPDFFRIQLAVLKIMAVIVLLIPNLPVPMKEWAYAGIGCFFVTALVAHIAHGDSWAINLLLLVLMIILAVSNFSWHRLLVQ